MVAYWLAGGPAWPLALAVLAAAALLLRLTSLWAVTHNVPEGRGDLTDKAWARIESVAAADRGRGRRWT